MYHLFAFARGEEEDEDEKKMWLYQIKEDHLGVGK